MGHLPPLTTGRVALPNLKHPEIDLFVLEA